MHRRFVSGFLFQSLISSILPLILAGSALAAPLSSNADPLACATQADAFLNGRLDLWQKRLNLADWKITLVLSQATDLKPKTLGNIHWDASKKTAAIRVLSPSGYQLSCRDALSDMEVTLVHELVHLELSALPRSPASRREEEFAVNRIADAFLRLDRQNATLQAELDGGGRTVALASKPDGPRPHADVASGTVATK